MARRRWFACLVTVATFATVLVAPASADNAPMWESPVGLTPGVPSTSVGMQAEDVSVVVHERGSSAVASVTAVFDMFNSGPDSQMLVGFPNFVYSALPIGAEYDPVMFTPANITNFRAWTDSASFTPATRRVTLNGQFGGSDWFVWNMSYPRGKVTPVHVAYDQLLDTQFEASWYRPIVHVTYVLRTGALWSGTIGKAHVEFSAQDGGGFVGSSPLTEQSANTITWDFADLKPTFDVESTYIYVTPWHELQDAAAAANKPDAQPEDALRAAQASLRLLGTNGPYSMPATLVQHYADATRQWAWRATDQDSAEAWEAVGDIEKFFAMPQHKHHGELACWPEAGASAYEKAVERGSETAYEKRQSLDESRDFGLMMDGTPLATCAS